MARFIKEFKHGEIKNTLRVRGEEFSYTLKPCSFGMKGDAPCFLNQIQERYPKWTEDSDAELEEAIEDLDFGDDEEIQEALKVIEKWLEE